jgi:diaminohydroxyphosphoribosylaminopyrimidine deaminase / 5-amino-6-(5-phosphoribosylamino)uracil reductase
MDMQFAMKQALDLARGARGTTLPNPVVAALVWDRQGNLVGKGVTQPPGGKHAEVLALEMAGKRAQGGTMVVTLEPCVAFPGKRTPPCSGKVLQAGIEMLVVGCMDPNPLVAGKGMRALTLAGLKVKEEGLSGKVQDFYGGFAHHMATGRPRVTLKIASSRDGMATAIQGSPTTITGTKARLFVHQLRANSDWILVGKGTVLSDNPKLTVRDCSGLSPHRVVLWSGDLPQQKFFVYNGGPTSFAGVGARPSQLPAHVEWIELEAAASSLQDLLTALGERGVHDLLVEPGPGLLHSFLALGAWDRLWWLQSPKDIPDGVPFDPEGLLPQTPTRTQMLGDDRARLFEKLSPQA